MTNATLLQSLPEAGEGSRDLDAKVWAAVNGYELFEHDGAGWRYRMHPADIMRHERTGYISPFTTSLDAALALAERVLPGLGWGAVQGSGEQAKANVMPADADHGFVGTANTVPLAICIAILKAQSTEPNKDSPSNREDR